MSLILGARFQNGILLASDPFVFDNDGELPLKSINFDKIYISTKLNCAITAVGSSWVFHEFSKWLNESEITEEEAPELLPRKWAELSAYWKDKRSKDINEIKGTLRPISHSIYLMVWGNDLQSISIVDENGHLERTSSFALSGSGSFLVEQFLRISARKFEPSDTLEQCFELLEKCFTLASKDLYVVGQPCIVLVTSSQVVDLSEKCSQIWSEHYKEYFADIKALLLNR